MLTTDNNTNKNRTKNEQSVQDLPFTGPLKLAYKSTEKYQ